MINSESINKMYRVNELSFAPEKPVIRKPPSADTMNKVLHIIKNAKSIRNSDLLRLSEFSAPTIRKCIYHLKEAGTIKSKIDKYKGSRSAIYTFIS